MQFQVPQFIETEDKIVGPLSLRQFLFVAAAFLISALLYFMVQTWLWAICSIIIVGLAGGLAFVKIEGRPLANVLMAAFNFYWHPQTYIWKSSSETAEASVATPTTRAKEESQSALEEILSKAAVSMKKPRPVPITREAASTGMSLHKAWEDVQTGATLTKKSSDKQFLERKMAERYQIFQQITGERKAAKRVDYR